MNDIARNKHSRTLDEYRKRYPGAFGPASQAPQTDIRFQYDDEAWGDFSKTFAGACGALATRNAVRSGISVDDLSKAAQQLDKNGFTKAGRSLQKHGSRPGSKWNQSDINVNSPKQANSRAQDLVDDVLTSPGGKITPNPRGGWDASAPNGRTIRFNRDGTMQGFRE